MKMEAKKLVQTVLSRSKVCSKRNCIPKDVEVEGIFQIGKTLEAALSDEATARISFQRGPIRIT